MVQLCNLWINSLIGSIFTGQNRGTFNRIYCGEISRHALNTNNSGAGGGGGGGKTKLLEQKIPATYLALEDLIGFLSAELRGQGHDPVLNRDQFSEAVNREMEARFGLKFRDEAELSQGSDSIDTFLARVSA